MQLGRYRLEEQVGQGGMAVVWRGFDTQLRRTVAIKVLHPHLHAREDVRRRFDREAQAVARLHHPHILDVYDFSGLEADPSYLVTEFICGHTLRQFAEAHPFDPPELAAACLLPIAEALEHAHAAGVVHRDLKPENVMVREDGIIKLTDFGIAALLDPDEKFTLTGSILGSPAHLAPETIEGKAADPRSDLFSFGTILYWLSCGELPFEGPSPAALLRKILDGKMKDPRLVRPSVSDAQARIIARCLERDPASRYQSASELRAELERLLADELPQPLEVLARFVKAPQEEGPRVRGQLVARSLAQGEEELRRRRTSAALAAFGRVLALEPDNAQAKGRVERIRRRARLMKTGRRVLLALAAGATVAVAAVPASRLAERIRVARAEAAARAAAASAASPAIPAQVAATNPVQDTDEQRPAGSPAPAQQGPATSPSRPPARPGSRSAAREPQRDGARIARADPPAPIPVLLAQRVAAQVIVDDKDLGQDPMINTELAPGVHRLTVHHVCCNDWNGPLVILANVKRYPLPTGMPKAAQLQVMDADPDAQVWYADPDEENPPTLLGVVRDLSNTPARISMTEPYHWYTITVGDRSIKRKLHAGIVNTIDMAGEP